ncbi:hypothetical protein A5787_06865 [Mycobacterium sp. 852002-50816_SCH5313054-b]|uniref:hypothetical protein n=1 Tax=Mycobacterium sp. 852002-50816_SCH5313054-b TaxID=1834092 RepID=UPI0007FF07E4|nr:hypothetical protein [Mycobacterium sp. 852002-50816_SCH5313054-b]OBF52841.1 hypothetical protein A5787_06865 [Mycobacterium sp. 852002-50816_SCH5313054-b]
MTPENTRNAPPDAAPARRHSTAVVAAVGLAGLVLGAIAAFAITGLVFTVRVQLPPPPYPPPVGSNAPGCVYPAPPSAPTATPGVIPAPPLPPPLPR